jgi:hypothetical protein
MIRQLQFRKQAPPASQTDIDEMEAALGFVCPEGLREFYAKLNGGFVSSENSFYNVPRHFAQFYKFCATNSDGIVVEGLYGITDSPTPCSVCNGYTRLNSESAPTVIPIAYDLFGNYVVILAKCDVEDAETVYWLDHELWESPGRRFLAPIASNLHDFYNSLSPNPLN